MLHSRETRGLQSHLVHVQPDFVVLSPYLLKTAPDEGAERHVVSPPRHRRLRLRPTASRIPEFVMEHRRAGDGGHQVW